ncbi:MAG TPA: HEAT repeat domain-containing protein [Polyangiaceae bacterium]
MPRRPLTEAVRDPGFTPGARDLDPLVDMLADDELEKLAERAVVRLGAAAAARLIGRLGAARPPLRGRIVRVLGRLTGEAVVRDALVGALKDGDAKTRRNAAIALGHAQGEGVEEALVAAWRDDPRPEMRRSIAASLGKTGSARSRALLDEAARAEDAELARIAQRARMMIDRTASRGERTPLDAARAAAAPVPVVVLARPGLEDVLAEELAGIAALKDVRDGGPGRVRATLAGPMKALFGARTMLGFRFPVPGESIGDGEAETDAIARAVTGDVARAVLGAWTPGQVRYRIAWAEGGHKRAATWGVASAVALRRPELVNDPTASSWEVLVERNRSVVEVSLVPRAVVDPRFAWRKRDVPAASHPTVAAALARVAGVRDDDVVWDPFVGSAGELVERALLGPYRALHGSDVDARALDAARENLAAAGLVADLVRGDALTVAPPGVTLVVTNPPMGRRAVREHGLADALDRFVAHAASVLVKGGRLVWIAPWPARARTAATIARLSLAWARTVDMGGFDAELQRWTKLE